MAVAACILVLSAAIRAQSLSIHAVSGALHVRAPGFSFIKGQSLSWLKDGRAVRFDFALSVVARPGTTPLARAQESFTVSYDLWEERFAVTQGGPAGASISHLIARDAEGWCLDRLNVPLSALGQPGRDVPLWIRLEYEAAGDGVAATDGAGLSLRGLIDRLSRREGREMRDSIESGPLTIVN